MGSWDYKRVQIFKCFKCKEPLPILMPKEDFIFKCPDCKHLMKCKVATLENIEDVGNRNHGMYGK